MLEDFTHVTLELKIATLELKMVFPGLGNLISCLDDVIIIQPDWPISGRAVNQAGHLIYEV